MPLKNLSSNQNIFSSPSGSRGQIGRAQNSAVKNFGRDSISKARVSISQNQSLNDRPTGSVSRFAGGQSGPTSSIKNLGQSHGQSVGSVGHHPVSYVGHEIIEDNTDKVDETRYNYIRRLVQARKEKVQPERVVGQVGANDLRVRTGGGFRTWGAKSLRRQLSKLYKQAPSTYKNISMADRKYFAGLVKEHGKAVRVGKGFSAPVRRSLKRQVNRDWKKSHVISKQDAQDFKKIINNLPH